MSELWKRDGLDDPNLKQALANEPEQEPYGYEFMVNERFTHFWRIKPPSDAYDEGTLVALYTHPSKQKSLSDEKLAELASKHDLCAVGLSAESIIKGGYLYRVRGFARDLEKEIG